MNARVFLLVVVTGLFMAAWNSDQEAEQQFLAQRAQLRAAATLAQADNAMPGIDSSHVQTVIRHPATVTPVRPVVSQFRPDGLAAGSYRAVGENGVTFELTVESSANATKREFYVADSPAGVRWYFIRLQTSH